MNEITFWILIDESKNLGNGKIDNQASILSKRLLEFNAEDIYDFYKIFMDILWGSFRADLWDAAQIIACGCSEDVFEDFRAWLIGQGKITFDAVINNPEILASLISPNDREEVLNGCLTTAIISAYERKAGQDIPLVDYHKPLALIGDFVKEEEFPHKYPALFAKFGGCPD